MPRARPELTPSTIRALNVAWHHRDRPMSNRAVRRFKAAWYRTYRGSANYVKVGFADAAPAQDQD